MSFTDSRFRFHRFAVTSILTLNTFVFLNAPTSLKAEEIRDCTTSISAAQAQIETGREVEVMVRVQNLAELYPDHPENRPMSYLFILKGGSNRAIMRSPQFHKSIARSIIQNCSSVSAVIFGAWGTGWQESTGLFPDGRIEEFECLEYLGPGRKLTWGQEYCSL